MILPPVKTLTWQILASLIFILAVPSSRASEGKVRLTQLEHSTWRLQDGVFMGAPLGIAQTKDGYLWVGTVGGVLRFDGVRFVPWKPPKNDYSGTLAVRSLLAARDGSLWIGTTTGLFHWTGGHLTRYPGPVAYIEAIFEDHEGTIWIARNRIRDWSGPVCRVEVPKLHCYGRQDGIVSIAARSIVQDAQGNLWFGGSGALIERKAEKFQSISLPGIPLGTDIHVINGLAITSNDSVWAGLGDAGVHLGLRQRVDGHWRTFTAPGFDGSAYGITALFRDRDGYMWVGTERSGIFRFDGSLVEYFDRSDGLSSNTISGFQQDSEGDVWVATAGGLDVFRKRPVVTYSSREGLSADDVHAVIEGRDGSIWMSGPAGLDSIRDAKMKSITKRDGLPGQSPSALLEDREGRLWFGLDYGLYMYSNQRFTAVVQQSSHSVVIGLAQDLHDDIWAVFAGVSPKLIHIHDLKVREQFDTPAMPALFGVVSDQRGGIWVNPLQGDLVHLNGGTKEQISLAKFNAGYPSPISVFNIIVEADGTLWGASNRGLIGYRNGRPQALTEQNGLPCNALYSLIVDVHSAIWLYSQCGLIRINRGELERWWANPKSNVLMKLFDTADGVQPGIPIERPAATRSDDGRLWFANGRGVQVVDPDRLETNPIEPPVSIEQLSADDHPFPMSGKRELPALTREIQIEYTALSFVLPSRVRFRYRLEGYEADWREPGTRRAAFYNSLNPGHYRFHVIASNNDGVWNNTGATLDFSIAPAYYQTLWFRSLCGTVALGTIWLFYLFRFKHATEQIQERLGARLEERERIARELHDTLLQGFQGVTLRLQATLKTLPSDSSAHRSIEQVLDRADQMLMEGRQSVRDLREQGALSDELSAALESYGAELGEGTMTAYNTSVLGSSRALAPIVFGETCRIAREALFNAFQHSKASKIEAELAYETVGLCLKIKDNGIGLDERTRDAGRPGHWGLSGMRERAEKVGGKLKIRSSLGAGTEIELMIPAGVAYPHEETEPLWKRIKRLVGRSTQKPD